MSGLGIAVLTMGVAAAASSAPERGWDWHETTTPHFRILHQEFRLPPGLTLGVEHVHFRLRMDLGALVPALAKERVALYVYRDLRSYKDSEFHPPPWSNGVAMYDRKAVVVADTGDGLLPLVAHETTHLLFVSYFREQKRDPPHWINEGLALVEEGDSAEKPELSRWYQDMTEMDPRAWIPMPRFLVISPVKDLHDDQDQVGAWYVQAYSVTYFLLRQHSRLQFKSFCARLREGKSPQEALWLVYRYRSVADFEKKWMDWRDNPAHRRRVAALSLSRRTKEVPSE